MLFSEIPLNKFVQAALEKAGYTEPTKIQEEVIKFALDHKNIVGQSQTGTGKTAAFVIPLLELVDHKIRQPQAIILAPTRELASQIRDEVFKLSDGMFVKSTVVYGGSNIRTQREILARGPQIVVATPGRLIDLIDRRYIDVSAVKFFVLDEVDRMLDMGFVDDIDYIWSKIDLTIEQSMTFSATIPQEMKNLLSKYVGEGYEYIKATEGVTVDKIDHAFIEVNHFEKFEMLKTFIAAHMNQKTIVFTRTKHETEHLSRMLEENGISSNFLHGDLEQRQRSRALKSFQDGDVQVFVTTDVAARGLNMNSIELVVNYHVPEDPEAYIHRIGRTGRAGASGRAIMFVDKAEQNYLRNIERRNKIRIKQVDFEGNIVERREDSGRPGFQSRHGGRGGYRGGRGGSGGGYRGGRSGGYEGRAPREGGSSYEGHAPREGGFAPRAPREGGYQGHREGGFGGRSSGGYEGRAPREGGFAPRAPRGDDGYSVFNGGSEGGAPRGGRGDTGRSGGYEGRAPREGGFAPRAPREGGFAPRAPREGGYQGHREGGFGGRSSGGHEGRAPREGGFAPRAPREDGGFAPRAPRPPREGNDSRPPRRPKSEE